MKRGVVGDGEGEVFVKELWFFLEKLGGRMIRFVYWKDYCGFRYRLEKE